MATHVPTGPAPAMAIAASTWWESIADSLSYRPGECLDNCAFADLARSHDASCPHPDGGLAHRDSCRSLFEKANGWLL